MCLISTNLLTDIENEKIEKYYLIWLDIYIWPRKLSYRLTTFTYIIHTVFIFTIKLSNHHKYDLYHSKTGPHVPETSHGKHTMRCSPRNYQNGHLKIQKYILRKYFLFIN